MVLWLATGKIDSADKNLYVLGKHHFGANPSDVPKFGGYLSLLIYMVLERRN